MTDQEPIWTDDALNRLLGARDGYIKSLLTIRMMIGRYDGPYAGRFHAREVRKIERRAAIAKPLREIYEHLEADMRRCQEVYDRQYARAHPRVALASVEGK